jgi:DNA-binding transcriptional MerR regulator
MAALHPIRKTVTPPAPVIPDKLYFRIGDVARLCEVPAYVLRFWETEFAQLKPNKGGTGQRLYRKRDVEIALRIKHLLYDQGYTIPGARQVLKSEAPQAEVAQPDAAARTASVESQAASALQRVEASDAAPPLQVRRLRALREDLRALAQDLAGSAGRQPARTPLPSKPLRPQLVPEGHAVRVKSRGPEALPDAVPSTGPLPGQQDLFSNE